MGLVAIDGSRLAGDAALVRACLAGDRAAERELFRREFGRVNATLYRILGANRETEDLLQETFIEVFRSLPGFRGEARLSTWIGRIAVRVALHHLSRKPPATVPLELVGDFDDGRDPADRHAEARDALRHLYAVLATLNADARVAFALHVIDGRPLAEVARLMGASLVATKLRIWRARRQLARRAAEDPVLASYVARGRKENDDAQD